MITFVFTILMILVFGKMFIWSLKAAWGITSIVFSIILLPLMLIGLVLAGLIYLALPILLVVGIVTLIGSAAT